MKKIFFARLISCLAMMQSFTFAHTQESNLLASLPKTSATLMATKSPTRPYVDQAGLFVRSRVINTFEKLFKNPADVAWQLNNNRYHAYFNINNQPCIAMFNIGGSWVYTIKHGAQKNLPRDVYRLLKATYFDFNIGLVKEIITPQGLAWIVNLEDKDNLVIAKVVDREIEELHHYQTHL